MQRRIFLKKIPYPFAGYFGLKLFSCGQSNKNSLLSERLTKLSNLNIWAYYVPLTSYDQVLDDLTPRHALDLTVDFNKISSQTQRISGNRNDGTDNRTKLNIKQLENTQDHLRVKFWHDDPGGSTGHTLYFFPRHLDFLENGEKLYVATGMTQGHFHIVMVDPS